MARSQALRLAVVALALLLLGATAQPSVQVEGVSFPARLRWRGVELELRGAALLRYRLVFRGYVAALYLGRDVRAEQALAEVPRRIEIEYFWAVPAEAFARATTEWIDRNVDAATLERMREPLARLNALYADVEPGDRYALTYVPGEGTELARNGVPLGVVAGPEFSSALFAIWLGEEPFDAKLRESLLGRRGE